jgi:hypothetical protein
MIKANTANRGKWLLMTDYSVWGFILNGVTTTEGRIMERRRPVEHKEGK